MQDLPAWVAQLGEVLLQVLLREGLQLLALLEAQTCRQALTPRHPALRTEGLGDSVSASTGRLRTRGSGGHVSRPGLGASATTPVNAFLGLVARRVAGVTCRHVVDLRDSWRILLRQAPSGRRSAEGRRRRRGERDSQGSARARASLRLAPVLRAHPPPGAPPRGPGRVHQQAAQGFPSCWMAGQPEDHLQQAEVLGWELHTVALQRRLGGHGARPFGPRCAALAGHRHRGHEAVAPGGRPPHDVWGALAPLQLEPVGFCGPARAIQAAQQHSQQ
mmetsp:Transcript_106396/g.343243  ORF Transcript_106396/g.343243 Transcript_106396/m.343243 type:complete len:275 (-) Transcript_106396:370-1194(-)